MMTILVKRAFTSFNPNRLIHYARFWAGYFSPQVLRKENFPIKQKNAHPFQDLRSYISATERAGIRTPDNLIKSQVLYHLSYTPIINLG